MDGGEPGEEYIIASEPRNFVEVLGIAERLTGIPVPRAVPGTMFQSVSYGVAGIGYVTRPPERFESELLGFFATGGVLVDNSKSTRELGIDHRPLAESLQEHLEWEIERQGSE